MSTQLLSQSASIESARARSFVDTIHLADTALELVSAPGTSVPLGFAEISVAGVPLRSAKRLMFPDLRTPTGFTLVRPRLLSCEDRDSGTDLSFGFAAQPSGPMDWMLHSVRPRLNTADWSQEPAEFDPHELNLGIKLRPVLRTIGERQATGFSYQFVYHSRIMPLFRILDRATWEPGGQAAGNELWFRCPFTDSITRFEQDDDYLSTEWYLPNDRNPSVFQHLPLQTACHGFTMTAGDDGVLITWATHVKHIRTLIEKPRGDDVIVHWHEHCDDLSADLHTSPMEVLFIPGRTTHADRINLYEHVRAFISSHLHQQIGLTQERVQTYGVMEEWENADLRHYAREGVPKLADAGVKTIMIPNHFCNNMNEYGTGNMCCTVDWVVAGSVGEANFQEMCQAAADRGVTIEMWGNTALSTLAYQERLKNGRPNRLAFKSPDRSIWPELAQAKDAWLRNPSGAIEADHYTPVFACLNLRDETVRRVWLDRWKHALEHIGIRGIFVDSSFNLSSDKSHWIGRGGFSSSGATADQTHLHGRVRPPQEDEPAGQILSQYLAYLELMRDMQRIGYSFSGEDNGLFGVNRGGPSSHKAWQTIHLWGNAILMFDPRKLTSVGLDPDAVFFTGLAYRVMWFLYWHPKINQLSWNADGQTVAAEDVPTAWQTGLLRAFNIVEPHLQRRTVTHDEALVIYDSERARVVWALAEAELPMAGDQTVADVTAGTPQPLPQTTTLTAKLHHVYLLKKA